MRRNSLTGPELRCGWSLKMTPPAWKGSLGLSERRQAKDGLITNSAWADQVGLLTNQLLETIRLVIADYTAFRDHPLSHC